MRHVLPKLPYKYDALEPFIDKQTLIIHHTKHHKSYVEKLNEALEEFPEFQNMPIQELLSSIENLPLDIREKVRNHGGGHFNHSLFWTLLSPIKQKPKGQLLKALESKFGSVKNFKDEFTRVATEHFGSGYAWLCVDENGQLSLKSLPNQDTPLHEGYEPILLLDVWEHAYYLKYKNERPKFIKAIWNCINWSLVENKFNYALYEWPKRPSLLLEAASIHLS